MKRYFECVEGGSNKFWEVAVEGERMTVRYGRVGAAGATKEKTFASAEEAAREAAALVAEKTKKGYVEGTGAQASAETSEEAAPVKAVKAAKAPAVKASPATDAPAVDGMFAAIAKKEKAIAATLRPGASQADLATLRELGVPPAFLALYAAHDGSEDAFLGAYGLLPVADIVAERQQMNGLLAENPEWKESGRWHERLVPFASDGDGQLFCFDPIGAFEGSGPGCVVAYDHETGPAREFASFDVFVDLVTTLAKKGLLSEAEEDEGREKVEEAWAAAKNVGLAKMPPKELKKVLKQLSGNDLFPEQKLALALPLARKYPAEIDLWFRVLSAAENLENWTLAAEAAGTVERLTPARDRPRAVDSLVRALHRLGRDKQALAALSAALKLKGNYPASLIHKDVAPAFRHQCLVLATEVRPTHPLLWLLRGESATDRDERTQALQKAIECAADKYTWKTEKTAAERLLELDHIDTMQGDARLAALLALAQKYEGEYLVLLQKQYGDDWVRVARCATELEDWTAAKEAGERALEVCEVPGYLVLALHKLGREDEALAQMREVFEGGYDGESPRVLEALDGIPWKEPQDAQEKAFADRCLALGLELHPESVFLWHRRALRASSPAERRAAFEKVVALCSAPERGDYVPDPDRGPELNRSLAETHAAFRRLEREAKAQLAGA